MSSDHKHHHKDKIVTIDHESTAETASTDSKNVHTVAFQDIIGALADVLSTHGLTEVEYEENGRRIYLAKQSLHSTGPVCAVPSAALPAQSENNNLLAATTTTTDMQQSKPKEEMDYKNHPGTVKSPMVGVVYVAPEPGAEPFVRVGDTVRPGQTLLIVEAMKVLNPIKATIAGRVVEILIHDRKPVEYDEPLLVIDEA